ncbi:MAG: hypothetical protein K8T89_09865 [Planctomycetes bacterium]|nr:hypothetical protein [Planctomycetota bacterium]
MKTMMTMLTGMTIAFSSQIASAEEPDPQLPIPAYFPIPELPNFPKGVANQLKRDMERVNQQVHFGLQGIPLQAQPFAEFPKFRNDFGFIPEEFFRGCFEMPKMPVDFPKGNFEWNDQASSSWSCVNGKFCLSNRKNDVSYKVTGRMKDGIAVPDAIIVKDGKDSTSYDNLADVPDCHRKPIEKLLNAERE